MLDKKLKHELGKQKSRQSYFKNYRRQCLIPLRDGPIKIWFLMNQAITWQNFFRIPFNNITMQIYFKKLCAWGLHKRATLILAQPLFFSQVNRRQGKFILKIRAAQCDSMRAPIITELNWKLNRLCKSIAVLAPYSKIC